MQVFSSDNKTCVLMWAQKKYIYKIYLIIIINNITQIATGKFVSIHDGTINIEIYY